jgi:hypothetical protein
MVRRLLRYTNLHLFLKKSLSPNVQTSQWSFLFSISKETSWQANRSILQLVFNSASCHAATAVELAQAGYAVVGVDYEVRTFCRRQLAICPVLFGRSEMRVACITHLFSEPVSLLFRRPSVKGSLYLLWGFVWQGHGQSQGLHCYIPKFSTIVEDTREYFQTVRGTSSVCVSII